MPDNSSVAVNRTERVLAFMVAAIILVSVLAMLGLLITAATGVREIWPVVAALPLVGLPIAFLLLVALLVVSARRRSRAAKDAHS